MSSTSLAPLTGARDLLEVVTGYDPAQSFQNWKPQILMPDGLAEISTPVVFVAVNQKGGAGKTTSTLELGAAWAARGYSVRLIDTDPQAASLTAWLPPAIPDSVPAAERYDLSHVYRDECTLDQATWPTRYDGLWIVPSYVSLLETEYNPQMSESTLAIAIEESERQFDITIIDCTPSLGKLSISALLAADHVLIPVKVGGLDAMAMDDLWQSVRRVQKVNKALKVRAVILTAWDKTLLARELADRIAADYPEAIVAPIRRGIRASEAPSARQAIRDYDPACTPAQDYDQLADVIIPKQAGGAA